MPAVTNPSFETAGAAAGEADDWTTVTVGTAEAYLDLSGGSPALPRPYESFEAAWDNDDDLLVFGGGDTTVMAFNTGVNTTAYESFEVEWSNDTDLTVLGGSAGLDFGDGRSYEGFDLDWSNDDDLTELDTVVAASTEDFEAGWENDTDETTLTSTAAGSFNEGASAAETFVGVIAPFSFTVVSSVFQAPAHPLANTNRVNVKGPGLPIELVPALTYFVVNKATNTFQLALTSGGVPISVTNSSATTMTCFGDPAVYWIESYD